MIIFDLDGTLADCEHRRRFVERTHCYACGNNEAYGDMIGCTCMKQKFKPNWQAFYEACDKDLPIEPVCKVFDDLAVDNDIEIWSSRCESVRKKTEHWLYEYAPYSGQKLKMRPIGNTEPDEVLKERWLDELCVSVNDLSGRIRIEKPPIDFVFDSYQASVAMWRRRGIFVFNCAQHDGEV